MGMGGRITRVSLAMAAVLLPSGGTSVGRTTGRMCHGELMLFSRAAMGVRVLMFVLADLSEDIIAKYIEISPTDSSVVAYYHGCLGGSND